MTTIQLNTKSSLYLDDLPCDMTQACDDILEFQWLFLFNFLGYFLIFVKIFQIFSFV